MEILKNCSCGSDNEISIIEISDKAKCPACNQKGQPVGKITVQHLVKEDYSKDSQRSQCNHWSNEEIKLQRKKSDGCMLSNTRGRFEVTP